MKVDEFIKKVEDLGLEVKVTYRGNYTISAKNKSGEQWGTEIAWVSGTEVANLDTYTTEFAELPDYHKVSILRVLSEFALTPIGERNNELSYYIRPMPIERI